MNTQTPNSMPPWTPAHCPDPECPFHLPLPPSTCRDIVVDGLVSFEHSQYYPFELLAAVDNDSSFILHFSDEHRRIRGR